MTIDTPIIKLHGGKIPIKNYKYFFGSIYNDLGKHASVVVVFKYKLDGYSRYVNVKTIKHRYEKIDYSIKITKSMKRGLKNTGEFTKAEALAITAYCPSLRAFDYLKNNLNKVFSDHNCMLLTSGICKEVEIECSTT